MAGVTKGHVGKAGVVCVPQAGILADHAARPDADAGHGHDMDAARENHTVAHRDLALSLRFQVKIRVQEGVLADVYPARAEDAAAAKDHGGCGKRCVQLGGQVRMGVAAASQFAQPCSAAQQPANRAETSGFERSRRHRPVHQGRGGETRPPLVSCHA